MDDLMKRNVYLQLVVIGLIFLLSSVSGCQKNETVSDELKCPIQGIDGLKDNIVGKWKLVKGDFYDSVKQERKTEDYSCGHTSYEFDSDGRLKVNTDIKGKISVNTGEYTYEIINSKNHAENQSYELKIGSKYYAVVQSSKIMTIEMNPIDPLATYQSRLTAHFIRIQ